MDEHPFVAEIRSNPHDDEPRLIYADYLDEAGEAQGELIRTQVAIARLSPGDLARRELEIVEEHLLTAHADEWLVPLRKLGAEGLSRRSFQRGLVERVRISAAAFLKSGEELCRLAPALWWLEVTPPGPHLSDFCQRPLPVQIMAIDLCAGAVSNQQMRVLNQAVWTSQISALALSFDQLNDEAIAALVAGDWHRLERLNLSVNRLGARAARAIAQRQPTLRLESLLLSMNSIGDDGLTAIANSPLATTLRELDMGSNAVTPRGALALANSPLSATLERLNLRNNPLGADRLRVAEALTRCPRLKALDMRGTHRATTPSGYGSALQDPPPRLLSRLGDGLLW